MRYTFLYLCRYGAIVALVLLGFVGCNRTARDAEGVSDEMGHEIDVYGAFSLYEFAGLFDAGIYLGENNACLGRVSSTEVRIVPVNEGRVRDGLGDVFISDKVLVLDSHLVFLAKHVMEGELQSIDLMAVNNYEWICSVYSL